MARHLAATQDRASPTNLRTSPQACIHWLRAVAARARRSVRWCSRPRRCLREIVLNALVHRDIVSGVSGATLGNSHYVLLAGLAGMIASALSMGSGAYLAAGRGAPAQPDPGCGRQRRRSEPSASPCGEPAGDATDRGAHPHRERGDAPLGGDPNLPGDQPLLAHPPECS